MKDDEYTIQEINQEDLSQIAAFYEDNNFVLKDKKSVIWKYAKNPAGQARIFVVRDSASNIKGTLSYMPRIVYGPENVPCIVMQATDAFISPEVRGKSLYPKLLQHSMKLIDAPIYTFPNKIAERIEIKCGWRVFSPVGLCYFPIELGSILVGDRMGFLAQVVNLISRMYSVVLLGKKSQDIKLKRLYKFEEDFNGWIESSCGDRSAKFLNWRFIDDPLKKFVCFEFYYREKSIGYCVFDIKDRSAEVYDFVVFKRQRKCLKHVVEYCRGIGIANMSFRNIGQRLWRYGFMKMPSGMNLICYGVWKEPWTFTLTDSDWD